MTAKKKAVEIVRESWGDAAPDWVLSLAQLCDNTSQAKAAGKMRRSPSLVNMVLKNRYTGDLKAVEARARQVTSEVLIACPVLGSISGDTCLANQAKPFNPANHIAVALFRACRRCPNNTTCKGGGR